jgi:protein-export membrane protein SecD
VFDAFPGEIGPLAGTNTAGIDNATGLTIKDDIRDDAFLLYPADFGVQVLFVGPAGMVGEDVADAVPIFDTQSATWAVSLDLTGEGGQKFAKMTAEAATNPLGHPSRQISIVLDGFVISAPQVIPEGGITGGRATITVGGGEAAQQEANDLAVVLRYGSLPVSFEISAVQKVSATLGNDSLQAGIIAGLLGLILVAVVLIVIYRALGLLAIVGLTVFGSLLLALFGLLGELSGVTLTLAGVTGIIVSVGITADSYIVYYERVKEKIRQGVEVAEAAEEGFRLAYRTILTADTVSLLAATLLWVLAVGAVKGFAVALGLATILDLIIAKVFTKRAVGILATTSLGDGGWFSIRGASR